MRGIVREFRDFVMRGSVVDLAIAVVIGAAFGALITSVVENLVTPLIAAIAGEPDFSALHFTINDSVFTYGKVVNALITFGAVAAAIFFLVVKPLNAIAARRRKGEEQPAGPSDEVKLLTEIRDALRTR